MKMLLWSNLFWPYIGGAEYFGSRLVSALHERGYELIVLTSHDHLDLPDETEYHGVQIYRLPFQEVLRAGDAGRFVRTCRRVKEIKSRFNPDLILLNGVSSSTLFHRRTLDVNPAPVLARLNHQVLPIHFAGSGTLLSETVRSAVWVTCVSSAVLEQARRLAPEIATRSSVIYNGLEVPSILPSPLPVDPPVLLCLGRLVAAKSFDLALNALASIIQRYPGIRMRIAGDGPLRPQLEQQAAQLGLSTAVEFVGWVEPHNVFALINSATLVLIPSQDEGFPTVALQAALMGRPIVATRVGGIGEAVAHQQTGLLVENGDGLEAAIAALLSDFSLAMRMGAAGRERARKLFGWQRCVDEYEALFNRVVTNAATHKRHFYSNSLGNIS
ncbi:MAG TPA: glycosyltransferase family 4 protein [Candidatus Binatia bacterium]